LETQRADDLGFVALFLIVDETEAIIIAQSGDKIGQAFV
jgi:hypothetical protein